MVTWKDVVVSPDTPLIEVIARIDATGLQVAMVLGEDGRLRGLLTDGNIRRALLDGKGVNVPVSEIMNHAPTAVPANTSRDEMLRLMRKKVFHHLPLVDEQQKVVGLVTLDELVGGAEHPNWVVLMAGGLGTRLQPLTNDCPKPLLSVGGKPILETIIESFSTQGFRKIFLSVNYKADMISGYFGDGERWGVEIEYLHETKRMGTAGALSLLPTQPTKPIIVMNGDLLTHTLFDNMLNFHNNHPHLATMAVREYDYQVPYGVVRIDGVKIKQIEEKPVQKYYVNAGIYVLSPEALSYLPEQSYFDMPTLFERIIADGRSTAAYPLREYWLDIGRLEEFERAQQEWGGAA